MMTSQNWQINVICLVENCLSYNISKFGTKPITGKWDNLNWTKDIMTSSIKTFDLHLHNQDGLISTWSYYAIWLSGHNPYAYKIWAQLHQRFLRYKTKWDLTFDLHLHNQNGLISIPSYYAIWLSRHTPYAYRIWAQSDQGFLRYKTKWDLTFDLHLHNQDGVISTWCYYIIWLPNHITYACQIWDPSALWFLRYKTKGKCVWAYVRVCISCAY